MALFDKKANRKAQALDDIELALYGVKLSPEEREVKEWLLDTIESKVEAFDDFEVGYDESELLEDCE